MHRVVLTYDHKVSSARNEGRRRPHIHSNMRGRVFFIFIFRRFITGIFRFGTTTNAVCFDFRIVTLSTYLPVLQTAGPTGMCMTGRGRIHKKRPIPIQFVMQNMHKVQCLSCKKWMGMVVFSWIGRGASKTAME